MIPLIEALRLLNDGCPGNNDFWLCRYQEDDCCIDCVLCWERWLLHLANGKGWQPQKALKTTE